MRKIRMKKKIETETKKPIRRKCHNCGKMATNPLVYHIVPSYSFPYDIPIYQKNAPRTNRVDLKGDRKISVYNFCDNECYEEGRPKVQ
jgi:hypothetical protein